MRAAVVGLSGLAAACAGPGVDTPLRAGGLSATSVLGQGNASDMIDMGERAAAAGEHATAAGLFERALHANRSDPRAAVGFGDALFRLRKYQESAEAHRHVLRLDPADHQAARGYAKAMFGLNRPDAAVAQLEAATRAGAADPETLNALGVAYDLQGRHAEAESVYRFALTAAPGDVRLLNNLGLSLALRGEHEAAVAMLRPLAEGGGSDKRTRQNLALAYGLKGDIDAAARLSRLDLAESEVRANLAVFAALRAVDSASAASALAPVDPGPSLPRERAPNRAAAVPAPPVPLAAVALGDGDLSVGASPVGSWYLNLGTFPEPVAAVRHWEKLRQRHPKALVGLTKLAGAGGGSEPLLVGPALGEREAAALCARVRKDAPACIPVKL
jgi:Flp pilus assembly protein TadD